MTAASVSTGLVAALQNALPGLQILQPGNGADSLEAHLHDWRKRYRGLALAVVFPREPAELQTIVTLCAQWRTSIVAQGGNTGLVGGAVPNDSGQQLLVNFTKMNRILAIDPANQSITVQAGCLLSQVQDAAEQAGLLFPLSLASEGSCTIGGNLASNAGGTQVLRYGTARELCLGVQAVMANGDIFDGLKGLRKDNTGYAIKDLLVGSEGTLGLITAATLRLFPQPRSRQAALLTCPDLDAAVALLTKARHELDASLTGFEVMHQRAIDLALKHTPHQSQAAKGMAASAPEMHDAWWVLLDAMSPQRAEELQACLEGLISWSMDKGLVTEAALSMSQQQHRAMWQLRETIPLAEKLEGFMVKHDIGMPTSAIPLFVEQCQQALSSRFPSCNVVCFGHLGDGNLHYNVQAPKHLSDQDFLRDHEHDVNKLVYDLVAQFNGTISAEHGIGQLKKQELAQRHPSVHLSIMHSIKNALDPEHLLNPGRLID